MAAPKWISRLLRNIKPQTSHMRNYSRWKKPENYTYHVWIQDGSGRTLHTDDEQAAKLMEQGFYKREDGNVACISCGGNCGQCGNTSKLGNIGFSFNGIVNSLNGTSEFLIDGTITPYTYKLPPTVKVT